MNATVRLALVPRDGFFCKDGRGWFTSASGRAYALDWPWPSTMLGALRSAWGVHQEKTSGIRFDAADWRKRTQDIHLGTMIALRRKLGESWNPSHRVWPVPADALRIDGQSEMLALRPIPPILPTLGRDEDTAREALWRPKVEVEGKPLPLSRWWSDDRFLSWLIEETLPAEDRKNAFSLPSRFQMRVSIKEDTLTADDGKLFAHDVVETLERNAEWAIGAELALPSEALPRIAALGSDRRLAYLEQPLSQEVFSLPDTLQRVFVNGSAGLRLIVVTPACFKNGWLPDGLERRNGEYRGKLQLPGCDVELVLRAAFVGRPLDVSGWDMVAKTSKNTSRMVRAGGVYFLMRADGKPFGEADVRSLWLAALGERTDEGFGRVVPAAWNYQKDLNS